MKKLKVKVVGEPQRQRVIGLVMDLPLEPVYQVIISEVKISRNLDQNARMWAMLTDISEQVVWHGLKLTPENFKDMITAAIKAQKVVPGIDGGFVVLGARTSKMSIAEMSDVIEFATAFGLEHGVVFTDPKFYDMEF